MRLAANRSIHLVIFAGAISLTAAAEAQKDMGGSDADARESSLSRPLSTEPQVLDEALLSTIEGGSKPPGTLTLRKLLHSVERFHPKISMSQAKQRALEAKAFAQQGAYDPLLSAKAQTLRGGYYETTVANAEVRQYLGLWGTEVYGGYRLGVADDTGRYPTYESSETLDKGELRAGLSIPFFRDGPVDPRRAGISIAEDFARAGALEFEDTQLEIRVDAITAYYEWLAAGHLLDISERLLELAETRRTQVVAQRDAGSASDFEVQDSERMVFARQDAVAVAQQKLQSSAIKLSLYLRDANGRTRVPQRTSIPPFGRPPKSLPKVDVDKLTSCHPRYRALKARMDAARDQLELRENQIAPEARALFEVSRDLGDEGSNVDLVGTNFKIGVDLTVPLLLREGRGNAEAAEFELESFASEAEWLRDKLKTTAQRITVDQNAALRRALVARDLVGATELLAEGERYRLNAGGSTLFVVNLREIEVAQAATKLIYALAELHTMDATVELLNRIECDR